MAGGTYIQAEVVCPFYVTDGNNRPYVRCEGIYDSTKLTTNFRNKKVKDEYMHRFCVSNYKDCKVCQLLSDKYKEA